MKTPKTSTTRRAKMKNFTLGELIASTYTACGKQAPKLLQMALDSELVRFKHAPLH